MPDPATVPQANFAAHSFEIETAASRLHSFGTPDLVLLCASRQANFVAYGARPERAQFWSDPHFLAAERRLVIDTRVCLYRFHAFFAQRRPLTAGEK